MLIIFRHLHCIGETIGAYLHFSMHPSSMLPSSFMPPMQTRASTSQPTRMWGKLAEGELGKLEGNDRQHLNVLVHRVGGLDELKKALKAIPEKVKADPAQLIDHLCEIFKLDDAERSVCVAAFWNTHGALAVEEETSVFGGLWDLHGTHMRSWWWWTRLLKHPDIERAFSGAPPLKAVVYAMCLIAMMTCGPAVWPRICKQARKMLWQSGIVGGALEPLWGDALLVLCRDGAGGDTSNLSLEMGKNHHGTRFHLHHEPPTA